MESFPFHWQLFFKEGRTLCEVNFCRSLQRKLQPDGVFNDYLSSLGNLEPNLTCEYFSDGRGNAANL